MMQSIIQMKCEVLKLLAMTMTMAMTMAMTMTMTMMIMTMIMMIMTIMMMILVHGWRPPRSGEQAQRDTTRKLIVTYVNEIHNWDRC